MHVCLSRSIGKTVSKKPLLSKLEDLIGPSNLYHYCEYKNKIWRRYETWTWKTEDDMKNVKQDNVRRCENVIFLEFWNSAFVMKSFHLSKAILFFEANWYDAQGCENNTFLEFSINAFGMTSFQFWRLDWFSLYVICSWLKLARSSRKKWNLSCTGTVSLRKHGRFTH